MNATKSIALLIVLVSTSLPAPAAVAIPYPDALSVAAVKENSISDISRRGLVIGNGEMNAIVYSAGDDIRLRIAKNDCWDLRVDTEGDPREPHIAILYTRNSLYWQKDSYPRIVKAAYTALTFLGEPVTFVTERQLAEGSAASVQAILLPQATHVTDATIEALTLFVAKGGKLIALGDGNLGFNEYDRAGRSSRTPA